MPVGNQEPYYMFATCSNTLASWFGLRLCVFVPVMSVALGNHVGC